MEFKWRVTTNPTTFTTPVSDGWDAIDKARQIPGAETVPAAVIEAKGQPETISFPMEVTLNETQARMAASFAKTSTVQVLIGANRLKRDYVKRQGVVVTDTQSGAVTRVYWQYSVNMSKMYTDWISVGEPAEMRDGELPS